MIVKKPTYSLFTVAINTFSAEHQIQANAVCVSSWDYKQLQATAAEQTAALSALERETLPLLQVYHGNGAQRFANDAAAEAMAERVLQGLALHSQGFVGQGSVRKLAAGFGFSLTQHEQFGVSALHSIDSGDAADAGAGAGAGHYTVLSVTHQGWNNLSAAHNAMRNAAHNATLSAGVTDLTSHGERGTYRNHFTCVRADVAIVPTLPSLPAGANQTLNNQLAHHARPRTARGPQVALVVGVESNPVTSERNHQIKIQFPWQRGTRPIAGGLTIDEGSAEGVAVSSTLGNAPGNEQSGTWVRVAESLSGPNWGSLFTPRIGTEVLVDFIDGDIDQPIVVACLYNGCDTPPFSAGVDSGVNHAGVISGHHSHGSEDASQYNQWVVDDTRAQCRMRLASSIGTSQLNLGYLIHQAPHSAVRGAYRGQGFELRSDAWGVLRGAQGVLLTTHSRANATSTQLDSLESRAQLTAAKSLAEVMQQAAQQQQAWHHPAASLAMVDGLKQLDPMQLGKFASEVNGQQALKPKSLAERTLDPQQPVEQFAQAVVHIDSAASMNFATAASSLLYAGEHLQWCTQADTHWAAAHSIANVSGTATSLFTHSGGLQAIAANGQVSLQAHTDALKLLADNDVTVISANGHIEIKAKKKISLMAGQAAVTLEGGNISFACPGKITVKGGQHLFDKGAHKAAVLEKLLDSRFKLFDEQFQLKGSNGTPIPDLPYKITTAEGDVYRGISDKDGYAERISTMDRSQIKIEPDDSVLHKPKVGFDEQIQFVNANEVPLTHVPYAMKLANGTVIKGVTDNQGMTQRVVTKMPVAIKEVTLTPKPLESCCAAHAQEASDQEALTFKLEGIDTNATDVGESVKKVKTPLDEARGLTKGEIEMAKVIFKDSIEYSKVKIHNGEYLWFGLQNDETAMTPNGEMYFNPNNFSEDFSNEELRTNLWFMHEMVHVWQYQMGYPVKLRGAIRIGLSYEYTLEKGKQLSDYNMEAQGDLLADYWALASFGKPSFINQKKHLKDIDLYRQVLARFIEDPSDKANLP